jgi:hypothetical protein
VGIKHFLSRATNLNPKLPFDDNPLNSEETALAFIIKWYVRTAGGILFVTAAAKLVSVYRSGGSVTAVDPVFTFVRGDLLLVLVALLEIACGTLLYLRGKQEVQLLLILWLSTCFLIYRAGLLLVGYSGPCNCFGKPRSWLDFPFFASLDVIMKWILAYMLIPSCLLFGVLRYRVAKRLASGRLESITNRSL